ncbi:uncharacterized protein LOC133359534 isoform X2 [Lethenteron reissneri]|uniref:uncharacterized protein LOC133359534 isoform X2 n=1 Tax=Lethenteron reissneri TaxID=7753 RepID=UPI002AB63356|nr:uncharacterized protein LOC133359534 isoform X2 [Lethenteron reissneri]
MRIDVETAGLHSRRLIDYYSLCDSPLKYDVEVFSFDRPEESCRQQQLLLNKRKTLWQEQKQQLQEQKLQQLRQEQQQLRQQQQLQEQQEQHLQQEQQQLQQRSGGNHSTRRKDPCTQTGGELQPSAAAERQRQPQHSATALDASGSAGRPLDRKPSASESDADQRESQTTTQPDGPDGGQSGAADPNGHRLNNPKDGQVRDMDESKAAKLIKGKRPELKKWIGRDPTYLLDYLDSNDLISRGKYHGARDITGKVERANFLIDEFIDRDECLKLWRALESLQEDYPQLTEWISACLSTTHHACVRDMDESKAAKLIKGKRPELKTWIGRDPTYLLDYLDSRDLISRDIYKRARDITVKEERANFLIDEFIDRDEFLKLWRALESLQDHYPQLKEWISACVLTTHHAFEKAPGRDANVHYSTTPAGEVAANEEAFRRLTACSDEQLLDGIKKNMMALVEAIEGDVRPVLTKLFEKEIFTIAEMNAVSTTQTNKSGSEAASQLITMLLHKGDRVAREFWMALWNLKTNYPRMPKIFENVLLIIEPAV